MLANLCRVTGASFFSCRRPFGVFVDSVRDLWMGIPQFNLLHDAKEPEKVLVCWKCGKRLNSVKNSNSKRKATRTRSSVRPERQTHKCPIGALRYLLVAGSNPAGSTIQPLTLVSGLRFRRQFCTLIYRGSFIVFASCIGFYQMRRDFSVATSVVRGVIFCCSPFQKRYNCLSKFCSFLRE